MAEYTENGKRELNNIKNTNRNSTKAKASRCHEKILIGVMLILIVFFLICSFFIYVFHKSGLLAGEDLAIRICNFFAAGGFHYNDACALLEANYAVVIAVVSVVVGVLPVILKDKEEKIFGIRRSELKKDSIWPSFINVLSRIMVFVPLLLLFLVLQGDCVTGYYLLALTLAGMTMIFWYYLGDHTGENAMVKLVELFIDSAGNHQGYNSSDIEEYRMLLEDVGIFVEEENSWREVHKVTELLLDKLLDCEKQVAFKTFHFFSDSVYGRMSYDHENSLDCIFCIYQNAVMKKKQKESFSLNQSLVLLWAFLSASWHWASDEDVLLFLNHFRNYRERILYQYDQTGTEISWNEIYLENAVLLLFMECWMMSQTVDWEMNGLNHTLKGIFNDSRQAFREKAYKKTIRNICVESYEAVYGSDSLVKKSFERLEYDFATGSTLSAVTLFLSAEED